MRGLRRGLALAAALFMAVACADLDVENLNDPDRERALGLPGDVETLIAGAFQSWWYVNQSYYSIGMPSSCMADQHTSSWGNSAMREACQEPRNWLYNNDAAYTYRNVSETPWYDDYTALAAVRDGLIAIAGPDAQLGTSDDLQIGTGGGDTHRAVTFARFMQGIAHMNLALIFDEAFILDETTDLEGELSRATYADVADAAIGYMNEAITLAGQESFSIPTSWMGGAVFDSDRLIRLARTEIARTMAYTPRTVAERDAVDWAQVATLLENGIQEDFMMIMDDVTWWDEYPYYIERTTWARTDLRMVGPADQGGRWDAWEKTTAGLRVWFEVDADDARIPAYPPQIAAQYYACFGSPPDNSCGADGLRMKMEYRDPDRPFRPERGTYHFSGYASIPDRGYFDDFLGPVWVHTLHEMNMLRAEAYIRPGPQQDIPAAVDLINATRVTYGGLAAVTGAGTVPWDDAPTNSRCTPRIIVGFPPDPGGAWACGDLFEAMKYEKRMETFGTSVGLPWYDDRGWGDLVSGTLTQFPVPGRELLVLQEEIYSYGGEPGEVGSAPDIVRWEGGGLRPLELGDVPDEADLQARVALFEGIRLNRIAKHTRDHIRR